MFRAASLVVALLVAAPSFAADLCKGKTPGTVTFFDKEISRDEALPAPAKELNFSKPMFALLCLTDKVGPQKEGGEKFRVVLSIKQVNVADGAYSAWAVAKQAAVTRPELSQPRQDIIIAIGEDFSGAALNEKLDAGEYEFRLQAASEKGTGTYDATVDVKNAKIYVQELRKAGYLADGKVKITKE